MLTRLARAADAEAIARIYNQGIAERIATLVTEPPTPGAGRAALEALFRAEERGFRRDCVIVEKLLGPDAE